VELLRSQGIEVYTGGDLEDRHRQVLSHKPDLLVDVGFELIATALSRPRVSSVKAAIELSRTGITRLRAASRPPFPVVNIHDGRLKHAVENRNGVGEAVWHAVVRLTGMHLAGRRAAVLGYGPVGRGLAANARSAGMNVEVVEQDPVRRLFAHYDGFPTPSFHDALARAGLIVTATGQSGVVDLDAIRNTRDGVVLLNAGHGGDEISVSAVEDAALQKDHVADQVVVYHLDVGHRVTVLGGGHPLNIVLNSGSPEPVMLHFALLALTLEWLSSGVDLPGGEIPVERELEEKAAKLALAALNS
jgi:adenosylhomocysteinase